jgi:hypothetical protein
VHIRLTEPHLPRGTIACRDSQADDEISSFNKRVSVSRFTATPLRSLYEICCPTIGNGLCTGWRTEMNELFFRGDLTENVCSSLIIFLLLYVASFVLLRRWSRTFGTSAIPLHVISSLGAALLTMGVGFGLHSANVSMASVRGQSGVTTSIAPLELHRAIAKSLPVQKLEDQTLVFPSRD